MGTDPEEDRHGDGKTALCKIKAYCAVEQPNRNGNLTWDRMKSDSEGYIMQRRDREKSDWEGYILQ